MSLGVKFGACALSAALVGGLVAGCAMSGKTDGAKHAEAKPSAERGKYLIQVSGCNDCHTPGFMQQGEAVPEAQWLTGVPLGWKGPWGTTYASNLRLYVKDFNEQTWVDVMRKTTARPPMPWPSLHAMTDSDLRSVYLYLVALGPAGEKTPDPLNPGQTPKTPYLSMEPVMPGPK
jgi:hypothetical protein